MIREMPAAPDPWLPFRQRGSRARLRLFCLPPAGGGATLFRSWQGLLGSDIEVCAVQLPGREARIAEKAIDEMAKLVHALTAALTPHLDVPFAIFGHSMGGLVGFEVARRLRIVGKPSPVHLFVSATRAPHHADLDEDHLLPDDQLIAALRKIGGYPEEVLASSELMDLLLPMIRADAALTETYRTSEGEPLDCPITGFVGTDDHKASQSEVSEWSAYTRGACEVQAFPGGHDFLKTATTEIAQAVGRALALATTK